MIAAVPMAILALVDIVLLDPSRITATPPAEWRLMVKSGPANVRITPHEGGAGVCLDSQSASFSINREAAIDLRAYPHLTWSWRADILPARGDFRISSKDDQAAQLFVMFQREGLKRRAINYIWDTNAPVGTRTRSSIPLLLTIETVVVMEGSEQKGRWVSLRRNVASDFREFFGHDAPPVEAIRFQVNSQHTGSRAIGCVRQITFGP